MNVVKFTRATYLKALRRFWSMRLESKRRPDCRNCWHMAFDSCDEGDKNTACAGFRIRPVSLKLIKNYKAEIKAINKKLRRLEQ